MIYIMGGIFGLWLFGAGVFAWSVDMDAPLKWWGKPLSGWRSSVVLTFYIVTWPRTIYLLATGRGEVEYGEEDES